MPKPKPARVPTNWPSTLPYLSQPHLSPSLPRTILATAATSPSLEPNTPTITPPATPYTNIAILPITSPTHPACGQFGLFTTKDHAPGELICLYLGFVHGTLPTASADHDDKAVEVVASATEPKSDYDLSLDREMGLAIDADKMGNEGRFVNDYRGVRDRPNAEFRDVLVKMTGMGKGRGVERGVGVFVKMAKVGKGKGFGRGGRGGGGGGGEEGIKKGEEILVSYGRGFWSSRRIEAEAEAEGQDGAGEGVEHG